MLPLLKLTCEETVFRYSRSSSTLLSFFISRWTSIMSAMMRSLVTADRRFLEALTMLPLFTELQGSLANSLAVTPMTCPVPLTSSTHASISALISGCSRAITSPLSTKFSVALSTAATRTMALLDFPFLFVGDFELTRIVT